MDLASSETLRRLMWKSAQAMRPFCVFWETTYRCNLRCRHCYVVPDPSKREMDPDEARDLFQQISKAGVFVLTVSGGEFFLREDCLDILRDATDAQLAIRVFSNLTMVPEALYRDGLHGYNIMGFETSVYGKDAETHDAFTGVDGSFEATIGSIRRLRQMGALVEIKCSWTRHNYRQFHEIVRLAADLGCTFRSTPHIVARKDGSLDNLQCRMSNDELREFVRIAESDTAIDKGKDKPARRSLDDAVCGAGRVGVEIDPYGCVYPCVDSGLVAGDVRQQRFEEIWSTSEVLKQFRGFTVADFGPQAADLLGAQVTLCPAANMNDTGDMFRVSPELMRLSRITHEVLDEISGAQGRSLGLSRRRT